MRGGFRLVRPRFVPPLDEGFRPAVLANRAFADDVEGSGRGVPLVLALERGKDSVSRYETTVFPEDHDRAAANLVYAERLLKFLLWQRGGRKVYVGGPPSIADYLAEAYAPDGIRCNMICPGYVATEYYDPDILASLAAERPLGRMATTEEIAALALHLLGPDSEPINGATIPVDFGEGPART